MLRSPLREIQAIHNESVGEAKAVVNQTLHEELSYGYRLFNDLLQKHKNQVKVLLDDEMDEDENINRHSFTKINSRIRDDGYQSITELVSDIRCSIENCYNRYWFFSHEGKQAKLLETIMEQKLALLPRNIREKCTIQATNIFRKKEYLNDIFADSKRRRSGDYLGSSETAIMQQLQYEAVMLSEEIKKQKLEAKRIEEENNLKQLEIFEETVVSLEVLKAIKNSWQLPCIGMFICMFQEFLGLQNFNYTEFELASFFMDRSQLYRRIFTGLLATPYQRQFGFKKLLTYEAWSEQLGSKVTNWLKIYRKQGAEKVFQKYGIDGNLLAAFRDCNPHESVDWFMHLSLEKRLTVLQALCEAVLFEDVEICKQLAKIPIKKRQDICLGEDDVSSYHFFPQFANTDIRVYKRPLDSKAELKLPSEENEAESCKFELVSWDLHSLLKLLEEMKAIKKTKSSHLYKLQKKINTLYEDLSKNEGTFKKQILKGKIALMKDYNDKMKKI